MSNQSMEVKVKELLELKRMKEELEAEIAAVEDEIKKVMGEERKHKPLMPKQPVPISNITVFFAII